MKRDLLELKNDLVFQELFGRQKNSKITGHLISLILGREIKDINLDLNKRMLGNRIDSKTGRLDIRAKFNDGEDCNIELQVLPYKYMEKRMLEYWASMYGNKMSAGDDYGLLKPSISILIADYRVPKLSFIKGYIITSDDLINLFDMKLKCRNIHYLEYYRNTPFFYDKNITRGEVCYLEEEAIIDKDITVYFGVY